jgi:hypothetical protein
MPPRFTFNIDLTSCVNAPYGDIAKLSSPVHLVNCWNELQAAHKFLKILGCPMPDFLFKSAERPKPYNSDCH